MSPPDSTAMLSTFALVGRPNVGKSSLFNALTRTRDALVADLPGLTRDRRYGYVRIQGRDAVAIDTGGLAGGGDSDRHPRLRPGRDRDRGVRRGGAGSRCSRGPDRRGRAHRGPAQTPRQAGSPRRQQDRRARRDRRPRRVPRPRPRRPDPHRGGASARHRPARRRAGRNASARRHTGRPAAATTGFACASSEGPTPASRRSSIGSPATTGCWRTMHARHHPRQRGGPFRARRAGATSSSTPRGSGAAPECRRLSRSSAS